MTLKKRFASLALCALAIAPLSALANPIPLNGSFSFNGHAVTQFTSGGTTYLPGILGAGINTATSITVENPITITATPTLTFGASNDLNGLLPAGTQGYIVNPAPSGTYTLQIPQNGASTPFSLGALPFASVTSPGTNGDTFNFYATSDQVLSSVSLGNISELGVIILGNVADTQGKYASSPASVGLTFIDNAGALGYTGAFSAPPANTNVPEPGSLLLVGIGALGLGLGARKFKVTGRVPSGLQGATV